MNSVTNMAVTWAKRALVLKIINFAFTKRGGMLTLKLGAVAGVGYLAYSLLKDDSDVKKIANNLTRIDDIENNNPNLKDGDHTIVV